MVAKFLSFFHDIKKFLIWKIPTWDQKMSITSHSKYTLSSGRISNFRSGLPIIIWFVEISYEFPIRFESLFRYYSQRFTCIVYDQKQIKWMDKNGSDFEMTFEV